MKGPRLPALPSGISPEPPPPDLLVSALLEAFSDQGVLVFDRHSQLLQFNLLAPQFLETPLCPGQSLADLTQCLGLEPLPPLEPGPDGEGLYRLTGPLRAPEKGLELTQRLLPGVPCPGFLMLIRRHRPVLTSQVGSDLEQLHLLREYAANAVIGVDCQSTITLVNPLALELLQLNSAEECVGRSLHGLLQLSSPAGAPVDSANCPICKAVLNGWEARFEGYRFARADGTRFPVACHVQPLRLRGRFEGAVITFSDIEQRLEDAAYVAESTEKYATLFKLIPAGIAMLDASGQVVEANQAFERILRLNTDEHPGRLTENPRWNLIRPDLSPLPPEEAPASRARRERRLIENQLIGRRHADGRVTWLNVSAAPRSPGSSRVAVVYSDVTRIMEAEAALRQTMNRLQTTLDHFPFLVWLKDTEGRFLAVNQAFAEACGHNSPLELVGLTDLDLWPRDLAEAYRRDDQTIMTEGKARVVEEDIDHLGSRVWSETYKAPVWDEKHQLAGTVGYSRDITLRRRHEINLARERALLRTLLDAVPDLIFFKDQNSRYLGCNRAFERYSGKTEQELVGETDFFFAPPELAEVYQRTDQQALTSNRPVHREQWLTYADGTRRLADILKVPFSAEIGELRGVVVIARDITEQRDLQQYLAEAQRIAHMGAWILEYPSQRLTWSQETYYIHGVDPASFSPTLEGFKTFIHPDDLTMAEERFHSSLSSDEPFTIERRTVLPNGSVRWVNEIARHERNADGQVVRTVGTVQDITERKQVEERLRQLNETLEMRVKEEVQRNVEQQNLLLAQSRLAAMGEMIGNIAHQWRQPLNALSLILAHIQDLLLDEEPPGPNLDEQFATAHQLIQSMSATIEDFRSFFRPNKQRQRFSIEKVIQHALSLVEADWTFNGIDFRFQTEGPLEAFGYPNELAQVLVNVLSNAKDALTTRPRSGRWVHVSLFTGPKGPTICIADSGGGIPPNLLPRIFEPYYTTKEKGTGIGLYMSKMIVEKNMGGEISAQNTGYGAQFLIVLPPADRLEIPA